MNSLVPLIKNNPSLLLLNNSILNLYSKTKQPNLSSSNFLLKIDSVDKNESYMVNTKQYNRILERRKERMHYKSYSDNYGSKIKISNNEMHHDLDINAKESDKNIKKELNNHDSRRKHALKRKRNKCGRFISKKEITTINKNEENTDIIKNEIINNDIKNSTIDYQNQSNLNNFLNLKEEKSKSKEKYLTKNESNSKEVKKYNEAYLSISHQSDVIY